ncbi:polysaccharide export protein EpsE [Jeongeupia chitinilytica]|uniref:polysaccharide export protein EpsE n=1 Tax=Jeongeupia chitinilytica TaxID=1041641 RepID=UPI001E61632C|nr:polysaccharide export protein EpsE [Jeongeupia chitinilytica]
MAICLLVGAAGALADTGGDYRLGPGDVVKISVYDHPDLGSEIQMNRDGVITFPLIGKVDLNGLSFAQAEAAIAQALKSGGFIRQPNVNVLVAQYRSQRVAVLGEVNRPGRYALEGGASLVDLLAQAGGASATGGDKLVLVRGTSRRDFLLSQLLGNEDPAIREVRVQAGDVIFVPRMQQVFVYGEVNRPGNFRLEQNMTVMQALSVAGGFNPRASKRSLEVHRTRADGSVEEIDVKPSDRLQDNDVLYVQESLF